ncbi:MAG: 30S ribosomal protein S4 [Candidatus Diapherotrites archaeon]|nr:30S ribosomal protein S4 [Candidatus Diapherotrites archaeon]
MRRLRKKWVRPFKRWDKRRIIEERKLMKLYGLKNKKELWRAQAELRRIRAFARKLLPLSGPAREKGEKELLGRLYRLGLLPENATLDDVLSLTVSDLLERRLQTMVWRKGLARTVKQARQFIVHGHVYVGGRRVRSPSYWVKRGEENQISLDPHIYDYVKFSGEVEKKPSEEVAA